MGYSGRVQQICENGHYWEAGEPYTWDEDDRCCSTCKAPFVFCNSVDDTNGNEVGIILDEQLKTLELTPAQYETCNLGHKHLVQEATYRIPTEEEAKGLRRWWDYSKSVYKRMDES